MPGEVAEFLTDMPRAFAEADLVVSRAGMGAVSELAAAGKPSILVPLPGASDQHQLKNAQAFERAGAARLVLDREMTGARLVEEVTQLDRDAGVVGKDGPPRPEPSRDRERRGGPARCAGVGGGEIQPAQRLLTRAKQSRNNTLIKCFLNPSPFTSSASAASA